jgi:undecaprenyl-diphosphatase
MSRDALIAPPRRRTGAAVLALAALLVLIGVGLGFHSGTAPSGLDQGVDAWLSGWMPYGVALALADFGEPGVLVPAVAAIGAVFAALRWRRGVPLVVLTPIVALSLTEWVLKPLFARTMDGALSYPSGHATGTASVAFAVAVVVLGPGRLRLPRAVVAAAAAVCGLAVLACAVGLVAAGYHYATDTVGGTALAAATVLALAFAIDAVADRLAARRGTIVGDERPRWQASRPDDRAGAA